MGGKGRGQGEAELRAAWDQELWLAVKGSVV